MNAFEWWMVVTIVVAVLAAVASQVPQAAKYTLTLMGLAVAALATGFLVLP